MHNHGTQKSSAMVQEAQNIDMSLSALADVISAIEQKHPQSIQVASNL